MYSVAMGSRDNPDVIVIGAGIAGLACARRLAHGGLRPLVLEEATEIGGRCATERVEEQPVDTGLPFFQGEDSEFLSALSEVDATRLDGWPVRVEGAGSPCQPPAFGPREERLSFAEGVLVFPRHLARGLEVRSGHRILRIALRDGAFDLLDQHHRAFAARSIVLALPAEHIAELLATVASSSPELASAHALIGLAHSLPCLSVVAGYPLEAPAPAWDAAYPESGGVIHLASHDSAKRRAPKFHVLVYQCLPRWSRLHCQEPLERWSSAVLGEAARHFGAWAAHPLWTQAQTWRIARLAGGSELVSPMVVHGPEGQAAGLAGELFGASGGAEAAFVSGVRLADRLLGKELR
jgi:predicted NAD/FAD-dependent oxidoreductase